MEHAGIQSRSVQLTALHKLTLSQEVLPAPGPGEVLVETVLGALSVGTELACYTGADPRMREATFPMMTGYENVAVVAAAGPDVDTGLIGRRIVGTYGHRTHAILEAASLTLVPDGVPDEVAISVILAADGARAVDLGQVQPADRCLILGAGMLGLMALFNLIRRGVQEVTVVDPYPDRLKLPKALGAAVTTPVEIAGDDDARFDVAFECSAAPEAFTLAQEQLAPNARLVVVSDGNAGDLTLSTAFHDRELTVQGSNSHPDLRGYAREFFGALTETETEWLAFIPDITVPFDALPELSDRLAAGDRPRRPLVIYKE